MDILLRLSANQFFHLALGSAATDQDVKVCFVRGSCVAGSAMLCMFVIALNG